MKIPSRHLIAIVGAIIHGRAAARNADVRHNEPDWDRSDGACGIGMVADQ